VTESEEVDVNASESSASKLADATVTTAFDGTTESIPKPKAAIAVKAIRLKNVFFDITFLS